MFASKLSGLLTSLAVSSKSLIANTTNYFSSHPSFPSNLKPSHIPSTSHCVYLNTHVRLFSLLVLALRAGSFVFSRGPAERGGGLCVQAGRGLALPGTASPSLRPFYPAGWICPFLPVNHVAAMRSLLPPGAKPLNHTSMLITALFVCAHMSKFTR